jgi:hypothetical protein
MAYCLADALQVPCVSNHVGVTTIEKLDQSQLYPNHVGVTSIERLDQSHFYSNLGMSVLAGNRTWVSRMGSKHSSHSDSLLIAIRNIYI